jgi:hypothetical protein
MKAGPSNTEILLLSDPSPVLRLRVLTELLGVDDGDDEVADLRARVERDPSLGKLLASAPRSLHEMGFTLCRLAYAGLGREHARVGELAERVFAHQQADGSFPLEAFAGELHRYSMVPLQTALPLRGLAAAGFSQDPRAELAYRWLLDQRLPDGAWPSGNWAGRPGYIAGYRRLPGSRGCRANTTAALACLALHPERSRSEETRNALDLLLQRETREESAIGTEVARLAGLEPARGFFTFYARFDLAFIVDLASRAGASSDDERVGDLVEFLLTQRRDNGLWEHPTYPELSRWLTYDILASLRRLQGGDWAGVAFRTGFRAYAPRHHRY